MNAHKNSIEQLLKAMIASDRAQAVLLIERIIQQGMPQCVISDILGPLRIAVLWGKESS